MRPKKYSQKEHQIELSHVNKNALTVIHALQKKGHTAYLVGGGVRDLLMGLTPKDFDISTSARPDEIKQIFGRQCLLIGRRFRLAHIRFGKEILEVSTFRAGDTESSSIILRDNRWGNEVDDVKRRDFTINALFYDPEQEMILDYFGGVDDIKHRILKTIGDPFIRFKQDPVRMLRLLKFQARLRFSCEEKTKAALQTCKHDILKSSEARLLEEIFKMLESGHSEPFFQFLTEEGFLELLFPCFLHFFTGPSKKTAHAYLHALDRTVKQECLQRSVMLASLIFPILEQELNTLTTDRQTPLPIGDIQHLALTLLRGINTSSFVHFPRKLFSSLLAIILLQYRLTPMHKRPRYHMRFPSKEDMIASIKFLKIRALVSSKLNPILHEWEKRLV